MKIGIIGNGFVGNATKQLECKDIKILAYDLNPELCYPKNTKLEDLLVCSVIFISVPTPMKKNGECYLDIVKSVIEQLNSIEYKKFIVLRSTVPVGTCDNLNVYFMPEFLTEKNYINDFINNKDWIFGLLNKNKSIDQKFRKTIRYLFYLAKINNCIKHNNIHFLTNKESEMIKMFKNCFLSTKVSFCNEIYQFCQIHNINYENVRKLAANDDRILHSHTYVPGPDGKKGFGGTCFPKDTNSLRYEMIKSGMEPYIMNSIIKRNEKIDRPEKDWNQNEGRAVVVNNKNIFYKKTILIAGGCGFIGSNMCIRLLNEGNKIICLDNLLTGRIENIQPLFDNDNFTFINKDIIDHIDIEDNIDEIYHFACPASPPKYQNDPIYTLKINFIGTMNLLELARKHNCKILLSSTSEIYGEPEVTPQKEDYRGNVNTIGIRSCYDEGKRVAETLMMDYHQKYNIDIRIVRIFNTYGPNMDPCDGRVVTNFITQILNNENITIYGKGNQTRSFCYIDDQVEGLIKLMGSSYNYPVNIGNPYEMTIKELSDILLKLIDSKSEIIYLQLPSDDPTNRRPDISLAKKILDWEPKTKLENGLLKTIEYIKNRI
jgi:UDP-glucuronate decarboxylase